MRGLRTKIQDLCRSIACSLQSYDVIVLVETWLHAGISTGELGLSQFNVYRCDRSSLSSTFSKGGDVLIAAKNSLRSSVIIADISHVEHLHVRTYFMSSTAIFTAAYIPPAPPPSLYLDFSNSVEKVVDQYPSVYVFVLGDFNQPRVEWSDHVPLLGPGCNQNVASALEYLANNLTLCGLVQMKHVCNFLDSINFL